MLEYPSVKNKCPHYRYEPEERITYGRNDQVFCGEAEGDPRSTVKGSGSKAASGVREGSLTFQMDDEPGILSDVLKIIAEYRANILTIHQSIPINGIASLTLSIQVLQTTGDISRMIEQLEGQPSVHHVKILAKE